MLEPRTSQRPSADQAVDRPESPAQAVRRKRVIPDPYHLLLRRFTDRQFRTVLAHVPDTPAHLGVEGRFIEAARLVYPGLTVRHLVPGPCSRRPSSATEWWWRNLPCGRQQFVAALDVIRRICAVDEVCFSERKAA